MLKDTVDRLPSEDTLNRLLDGMEGLAGMLPRMERLMADNRLEKLSRLGDAFDDGTIDRLMGFATLLENAPKSESLDALAAKLPSSEELRELNANLAKIPDKEKLEEMASLLKEVSNFAGALRGG